MPGQIFFPKLQVMPGERRKGKQWEGIELRAFEYLSQFPLLLILICISNVFISYLLKSIRVTSTNCSMGEPFSLSLGDGENWSRAQ